MFNQLGVPAGWMSGAMVAMAILACFDKAEKLAEPVRVVAMLASGIAIGAGMTPQMLHGFGRYPASMALMACAVVAITITGALIMRRVPGFSRETAFFSAIPGALSYVFAVAITTTADLPRIAVVQVLRVFVLMAVLPLIVAQTGVAVASPSASVFDPLWLVALMFPASLLVGLALERAGVAGGLLFGAMVVSGVLHGSGFAPGHLPALVALAAQVLVGAWSGARFAGFDWRLLGRLVFVSLGSCALAISLAAGFAGCATLWLHIPFAQALLAFAPGGLEAMTLLAFALGVDPLFVGAHHLARFVLISLALPVVARFWLRGGVRESSRSSAADGDAT